MRQKVVRVIFCIGILCSPKPVQKKNMQKQKTFVEGNAKFGVTSSWKTFYTLNLEYGYGQENGYLNHSLIISIM